MICSTRGPRGGCETRLWFKPQTSHLEARVSSAQWGRTGRGRGYPSPLTALQTKTLTTRQLLYSHCACMCYIWWSKPSEGNYFFIFFAVCPTHSRETILFERKRPLILAQPISYFVPGAISEWLTPSAPSLLTTTRSTPPCMATEPTGATGTSTASSTWPCSVRGLSFLSHTDLFSLRCDWGLRMCICFWEHEVFWCMCTPVFMRPSARADCVSVLSPRALTAEASGAPRLNGELAQNSCARTDA